MNKPISMQEAMKLDPELKALTEKIKSGEISACACMGPVYGEPYCPCAMNRLGLKSSPEHDAAIKKAQVQLATIFGPGGKYYKEQK